MKYPLYLLIFILNYSGCVTLNNTNSRADDYSLVNNIQNGISSGNILLIPKDSSVFISLYKDRRIENISKIDIPINSRYYISQSNCIVCLDTNTQKIVLKGIDHEYKVNYSKEFKYPSSIFPVCILKYKNLVFLGGIGHSTKETFMYYDLQNDKWTTIELPSEVTEEIGRSIDDLLIDGEILYAVDDIISPKYIIKYDLRDINNIKYSSFYKLPFTRINERIQKAILNEGYLVYLSSSGGTGTGLTRNISILKLKNLSEGFQIQKHYEDYADKETWADIALLKNNIYIIDDRSLYRLRIINNYFNNSKIVNDNMLEQIKEIEHGKIIGLRALEKNDKIILIIKSNKKILTQTIDL